MSECSCNKQPDKRPEFNKCDFCDYNFDFKCCDHKDKCDKWDYDDDKFDKCDCRKKEEKHVCFIPVICCKCEKKDPCKDRY